MFCALSSSVLYSQLLNSSDKKQYRILQGDARKYADYFIEWWTNFYSATTFQRQHTGYVVRFQKQELCNETRRVGTPLTYMIANSQENGPEL